MARRQKNLLIKAITRESRYHFLFYVPIINNNILLNFFLVQKIIRKNEAMDHFEKK